MADATTGKTGVLTSEFIGGAGAMTLCGIGMQSPSALVQAVSVATAGFVAAVYAFSRSKVKASAASSQGGA